MSSPKQTEESMSSSEQDGESTQDSVKVKDEPVDSGYDKPDTPPNNSGQNSNSNSNSNSRSSSPCPPVHFGNVSPAQGRDSPSQGGGSASSGPPTPFNDGYSSPSSLRTHMQGSNTGKKTDTVQNIVEGLLKKNATLLAMSDTESLRPHRRQKTQEFNNGRKDYSQSAVFPVSSTSQARLTQQEGKRMSQVNKPMLLRPKSPTRKCDSVLRDKTQLSYSLMESAVGDEGIEKIFKVQHHELVCAVASKPFIFDKLKNEKRVVASLDNNYFWCNFCSFSSSNKSLITNHIMDHRFNCKYCPYESFCRSDVMRHMGKIHEEFADMANNLSYCTFLSDYIRVKSRADDKENNEPTVDQDEDVGKVDDEKLKSYHAENLKRKREQEDSPEFAPKWAKMDSPDDGAANGQRQGKSRKSQNPRRHPQVNEKDYDTFEMEVEEIDESENGTDGNSDRVMYPSVSQENSNDHRNQSMGSHMQLIPSLQDEESHGYTATHVSRPRPTPPSQPRVGRPPTYTGNRGGGGNRGARTASASSLYWSCGYCDFQSSSQAEIKEHSNRTHPGKPHRYKEVSMHDTGWPPDKDVQNKDKECTADDNLPSFPSQGQQDGTSTSDLMINTDKSDNCATNVKKKIVCSADVSGDGSFNSCSKESSHSDNEDVMVEENERDDNVGSSFVKFKPLQMSPPSTCSDDTNSQLVELINTSQIDTCVDNESKTSKEIPRSVPSSLKLKFRKVDGATTVCSPTEDSNRESAQVESQSDKASGDLSIKSTDYLTKMAEEALVDSSSDSDSESSSICNEENIGNLFQSQSVCDENNLKDKEESSGSSIVSRKSSVDACIESRVENPNPVEQQSSDRLVLSCIPARSAAVKAMTRMKPVFDEDIFTFEVGTKHSSFKKRHSDTHDKTCASPVSSRKAIYDCHYCNDLGPSCLRTVKSHLANKHHKEPPLMVNLRDKQWKKKSIFYICPFSTCTKLFALNSDLVTHQSTSHPHMSIKSKETAYQSSSSTCVSSLSSPILHVPSEAKNIPECRVLLRPLSGSDITERLHCDATSPDLQPLKDDDDAERFECLYCTDHFSHSTLSGMKLHYAAEHPGQLLVFRDMEAKKEKLASRIYVCEESDCQFTAVSRTDLDAHAKCHKSNCTFVYECAACGWYSSSYWTAKDHLKEEHSIQDSGYLIHMQLSVDENGQTSKKILRSV